MDGSCEKEVLHRGKEERNIVNTINERRLNGLVTRCLGIAI